MEVYRFNPAIWCFILLALLAEVSVSADESSSAPPEVPITATLSQFSEANFREKAQLVSELEASGSSLSIGVLETLLAGEMYFERANKTNLVRFQSLDATVIVTQLPQLQHSLTLDSKSAKKKYKKVRINNKLRSQIKTSIAKISLTQGDEAEKLAALNELMGKLEDSTRELLVNLSDSEPSLHVQQSIQRLLALDTLQNSQDTQALSDAITIIGSDLEPAVLSALIDLQATIRQMVAENKNDESAQLLRDIEATIAEIERKKEFFGLSENIFFGLSLGSVLLLAAIGLAITFGVMGVINMAHGEMIMLGAYTTYVIQQLIPHWLNYSLLVAIPSAFIVSGLVGILIQRTVIRKLHGRALETLLATFGISLILQQAVRTIFSPLNRQVSSPDWMSGALQINPVFALTYNRLFILLFSLFVFVLLVLIMKKTVLGLQVRAVSQNRDMARSMGVRTERVDALTFGLGSGVAGIAGVALSQLTNVGPNLGQAYIVDSFMVVVFGGVGNLLGTLVGAFSLGVANKFLEPMAGAVLAKILVLVFIILYIQKRPKGLFPQRGRAAE